MQLYRPDDASGALPLAYFHAMARTGVEGLVLIEPELPFVSVGAFDDTAAVIDLAFCRDRGIPVVRRETGGGPVLLGPGQVFYTLVVRRGRTGIPGVVARAYERLSAAPIAAYRHFGIETRLRPINDLVTASERKIAGQGAADIEGHFCFVGSVLRHFDVDLMCRVLRTPDAGLRARLKTSMDANMTWMARELRVAPGSTEVQSVLAEAFVDLLGPLPAATLPAETIAAARALARHLASAEVLLEETGRRHAAIKIREGVYVHHGVYAGDDYRVTGHATVIEGRIDSLTLEGDAPLPYDALALALIDVAHERETVMATLAPLLDEHDPHWAARLTEVCLGRRLGPTAMA